MAKWPQLYANISTKLPSNWEERDGLCRNDEISKLKIIKTTFLANREYLLVFQKKEEENAPLIVVKVLIS